MNSRLWVRFGPSAGEGKDADKSRFLVRRKPANLRPPQKPLHTNRHPPFLATHPRQNRRAHHSRNLLSFNPLLPISLSIKKFFVKSILPLITVFLLSIINNFVCFSTLVHANSGFLHLTVLLLDVNVIIVSMFNPLLLPLDSIQEQR